MRKKQTEILKGLLDMKKYYIAYGSNMNTNDMKKRCPAAKRIGKFEMTGYRLMFNKYATIIKAKNSSVPAVLWEISEEDEKSLDIYEGFPKLYRKKTVVLYINDKKADAFIYIMNNFVPNPPTKEYFDRILYSYREHYFETDVLKEALTSTISIDEFYDEELCTEFVKSYFRD